jgi:hypothetical protein
MYEIKQVEPEGWSKAFALYRNGERIAYFTFRCHAEWYVEDHPAS